MRFHNWRHLGLTAAMAWHLVSAEPESFDSNVLSLMRRGVLEDASSIEDPGPVESSLQQHQRSAVKHPKARQSGRHAQIDANGHMVWQHRGLNARQKLAEHPQYESSHHPNMSVVHELLSKKQDLEKLDVSLKLAIDASGIAKGLPEAPADQADDPENMTEVQMLEEARQHRDLKNGKLIDALKQMKEWDANSTRSPWTQEGLIQTIATLNGQVASGAVFPREFDDERPLLPTEESGRSLFSRFGHPNLPDPHAKFKWAASLAQVGMVPQDDIAKGVVGFLFGACEVIDEDYPFLCLCDGSAMCINDGLQTTCRMRRGFANNVSPQFHFTGVVLAGILLLAGRYVFL